MEKKKFEEEKDKRKDVRRKYNYSDYSDEEGGKDHKGNANKYDRKEGKKYAYSSDEESDNNLRYDRTNDGKERKERDIRISNSNRHNTCNSESDNESSKYRQNKNENTVYGATTNRHTIRKEKDRRGHSASRSRSIASSSPSRSRINYNRQTSSRYNNSLPTSYRNNYSTYESSSNYRNNGREGRYKQYNGYNNNSSYTSSSYLPSRYGRINNYRQRSYSRSLSRSKSRNRNRSRSRNKVAYGRINDYDDRDYYRKTSRERYEKSSGFSCRPPASPSPPTNFSSYPPPYASSPNVSDGISASQNTTIQTPSGERIQIESRSVYVGNVDYSSTPQDLQEHFKSCGLINRITIMVDKFTGHPKGFAYIEFGSEDAVQNAVLLTDTFFKGRQIKVNPKRKNVPGYLRAKPVSTTAIDQNSSAVLPSGLDNSMFTSPTAFHSSLPHSDPQPVLTAAAPISSLSAPYSSMGIMRMVDMDDDILGENTVMDKPF